MEGIPRIRFQPRCTTENRNAALLLLRLKSIAAKEISGGERLQPRRSRHLWIPPHRCTSPALRLEKDEELEESDSEDDSFKLVMSSCASPRSARPRTVSVESLGGDEQAPPSCVSPTHSEDVATSLFLPEEEHSQESPNEATSRRTRRQSLGTQESPTKEPKETFMKPPSHTLVGTTTDGPVRDVLKRKFSWKNYPVLEEYLVEHREQYLRYSSKLNYTAEQKRYNNLLTQGLLDLAAEEGLLFEGFTFAAIRDRIRCYYKSYVQANKKKRKKRSY